MTRSLAGRSLAALALVPVLALASACGGGSDDTKARATATTSAAAPTPSVDVPAGVTLTKAGTELGFAQPATVAWEANAQKSTVLQLSVDSVQQGQIADLAAYQLDDATKTATPYYAKVTVTNVGTGDVGGTSIPLWGLSSDDSLIGASSFTAPFNKCASTALPAAFAGGATTSTCLMYLVPQGATLKGVSYRPVMTTAPIEWKGDITAPTPK